MFQKVKIAKFDKERRGCVGISLQWRKGTYKNDRGESYSNEILSEMKEKIRIFKNSIHLWVKFRNKLFE